MYYRTKNMNFPMKDRPRPTYSMGICYLRALPVLFFLLLLALSL